MKFKINNRQWEIKEISQEEMKQKVKEYDGEVEETGRYFGSTQPAYQTIYIDKDLIEGQKRQTLLHELMHCYILSYLFSQNSYNEEDLCNISACSHDIINEIVTKYFK